MLLMELCTNLITKDIYDVKDLMSDMLQLAGLVGVPIHAFAETFDNINTLDMQHCVALNSLQEAQEEQLRLLAGVEGNKEAEVL